MANPNDGTLLNPGSQFNNPGAPTQGDVAATEDMPVGAPRQDGLSPFGPTGGLPLTDYKLPRGKIATGAFDQDGGDVTFKNPLPVESRLERQTAELRFVQGIDLDRQSLMRRSNERVPMISINRGER